MTTVLLVTHMPRFGRLADLTCSLCKQMAGAMKAFRATGGVIAIVESWDTYTWGSQEPGDSTAANCQIMPQVEKKESLSDSCFC